VLRLIAAVQGGRHANGREAYGDSLIADPWGVIPHRRAHGPWVVLAGFTENGPGDPGGGDPNPVVSFFTLPESGRKGGCGSGSFGEFFLIRLFLRFFIRILFLLAIARPGFGHPGAPVSGRCEPPDAVKASWKILQEKIGRSFGFEQCFCL
jgi:hypothetical protein